MHGGDACVKCDVSECVCGCTMHMCYSLTVGVHFQSLFILVVFLSVDIENYLYTA